LPATVIASSIAVNGVYPASVSAGTYSNVTGVGSQSQALNMNSHQINGVSVPSLSTDAATKGYVDTFASGSTNYIQNTGTLQAGSTFYTSSGTVNSFTVGTSITMPAGILAPASLATGSLPATVIASSIAV